MLGATKPTPVGNGPGDTSADSRKQARFRAVSPSRDMSKRSGVILLRIGKAWIAVRRWIDAWWGYDVFIAHRRADAADYAGALHSRLAAEKISGFIDRVVYGPGAHPW